MELHQEIGLKFKIYNYHSQYLLSKSLILVLSLKMLPILKRKSVIRRLKPKEMKKWRRLKELKEKSNWLSSKRSNKVLEKLGLIILMMIVKCKMVKALKLVPNQGLRSPKWRMRVMKKLRTSKRISLERKVIALMTWESYHLKMR
jgi:hypothetical protein